MKDPLTLCTGQTYDWCSIEPWLEAGDTTCPATMLQLESREVVPIAAVNARMVLLEPRIRRQCSVPVHGEDEVYEEALAVLVSLVTVCTHDELVGVVVSSMLTLLCKGSLAFRVNVATIPAAIATNIDVYLNGAAKTFQSLEGLLGEDLYLKVVRASLRDLHAMCKYRHRCVLTIEVGMVPALIDRK
nr:U-box domain-containing protein 31-like [Physcomitrium patens]|eukprot:XP_024360665.1 U-box domain-containing protein 31-like [Physcomitrella patens]